MFVQLAACDDYTYGQGCVNTCNANCDGACNKVNGTCPACMPGFKGEMCTEGKLLFRNKDSN